MSVLPEFVGVSCWHVHLLCSRVLLLQECGPTHSVHNRFFSLYVAAHSLASDIFSLAIVLYELVIRCITGEYRHPYQDLLSKVRAEFQIFVSVAQNGLRPPLQE